MPEEIPKLDLLIKMMGMTTSDNDNTALIALRKATAMLTANGWDWERLLRGKVKVINAPTFTGPRVDVNPTVQAAPVRPMHPTPNYSQPKPQPAPQPKPKPKPAPSWTQQPAAPQWSGNSAADITFTMHNGGWHISSKKPLNPGDVVAISKKDGSTTNEKVGQFVLANKYAMIYTIDKSSQRNAFA